MLQKGSKRVRQYRGIKGCCNSHWSSRFWTHWSIRYWFTSRFDPTGLTDFVTLKAASETDLKACVDSEVLMSGGKLFQSLAHATTISSML